VWGHNLGVSACKKISSHFNFGGIGILICEFILFTNIGGQQKNIGGYDA
jgi:hypothetical protein